MNTKIRAVLLDDETNAISAFTSIVEEFIADMEIVGTATNPKQIAELIGQRNFDVLFVDIQMPHINGIDFVNSLPANRNFEVIFLTAFNTYAQEAFKANVFSYLLKPIHLPDLLLVVEKLKYKLKTTPSSSPGLRDAFNEKISISSDTGIEFIDINQIIHITASGSYTELFLLNNTKKVVSKNLKHFEDLLKNKPFFRAHKSHLININYIRKFIPLKDGGTIIMTDNSEIDLSRFHKDEFLNIFK